MNIILFVTLIIGCFQKNIFCMEGVSKAVNNTLDHPVVDVLILGAGYAGIGAAITLRQRNIDNFLVIEAKDYIGGRVKDEIFGGKNIPIGAGWLHKTEENHVNLKLARKYKLKTFRDTYAFNLISFRHGIYGYRFNQWYVKSSEGIMRRGLKRCLAYAEREVKSGKLEMSLRDCLQLSGWDIRSFKNEKIREAIDYFMYDFENGGKPEDISAWQLAYTGEGEDEIVTDPRGYIYPILEEIKPFRKKFILNTEVSAITKSRDHTYIVTTSNHKTYAAKHLIVTFSSGVLLAQKVKFTPPLPPWKMKALQKVPMGHYCKLFFQFPYQFWEESTYIILATKTRGNYVHWQNLNQAHLFPGSNMLLCTLTGETCREKHALPDKEIIREAMGILRIQVPYKNAPDPIALKRSSWSTDPHVMGAYSLPTAGITPSDYTALEHPLHNSLWFAGEYANLDQFGYTHGAYEHGEKIVGNLIKCMCRGKCPGSKPTKHRRSGVTQS